MKARPPQNTLLALTLDQQGLHAVQLYRSNGHVQVSQSLRTPLALNPLTADPQLVGREIRNHLDQAGLRERRCAVGLPLQSAFTLHVKLPELPEEDLDSFLQVEAERGFPHSPDLLSIDVSRHRTPEPFATLVAIPRQRLEHLQQALQAAQLRPLSFTLAVTSWHSLRASDLGPRATLVLNDTQAELLISEGEGIATMRTLDLHIDPETQAPDLGWLAREIRVTLGQLPETLVNRLKRLEFFAQTKQAESAAAEVTSRLTVLGLDVQPATVPLHLQKVIPPDAEPSAALFLGASHLKAHAPALEFLPPKVSRWQQLAARVQARRLAWAGAAAALIALLIGGAFLYQQWKLTRLERQWTAMEPSVSELDALQDQIKQFRPWTDHPFRSLVILRGVTESFPAEGTISAKRLEIRGLSAITLTGVARDNQAVLDTLDQLGGRQEINELKVDQLRGKTPLQFTFNFNWVNPRDR